LFFDTFERCKVIDVMTVPAQHPTLERDFYVILADTPDVLTSDSLEECVFVPENVAAAFRVYINPLVNLLWWGGGVLMLGTVIAMWPQRNGGKKS
jgi:cytochrome c-type biogenesis protein CcmF